MTPAQKNMSGEGPLIFMVAGENSGDALGADLMKALDKKLDGRVRFSGVGGPLMVEAGFYSQFPMEDLAVMGVFEVLPRLRLLLRRMKETALAIERLNPDVVVTIDAPDFCFRVVKKLRARGNAVPVVHYVAPTVWAWRPGRAKKVARFLDHLLCLLPFEPPYFQREGLDATFVGHPVVTSNVHLGQGTAFRELHGIAPDTPLLTVLPGSRMGEVSRLLSIFGETVEKLAAKHAGLTVLIPAVPHLVDHIRQAVAAWTVPVLVTPPQEKAAVFAASGAALAASGTVTLELAMAGLPQVVAYRVSPLTAMIGKMLIKTPYANLVNICLGREAVPEFIQENCTPDNLAAEVSRLMTDQSARAMQRTAASEALTQLGLGGPPPGERAADVVLSILRHQHKER